MSFRRSDPGSRSPPGNLLPASRAASGHPRVFGVGDPDPREEYARVMTKLMRANTATLMLVPALYAA
jgi:hypothetical protein